MARTQATSCFPWWTWGCPDLVQALVDFAETNAHLRDDCLNGAVQREMEIGFGHLVVVIRQ
jgi:hypothetical protein